MGTKENVIAQTCIKPAAFTLVGNGRMITMECAWFLLYNFIAYAQSHITYPYLDTDKYIDHYLSIYSTESYSITKNVCAYLNSYDHRNGSKIVMIIVIQ